MTKQEIKKIILKNKSVLRKYDVRSIALFGSFVRGGQRKNSDIDFLVSFRRPSFNNYMGLVADLDKLLHRKVDLISIKALKEKIKPYILKEAEWLKVN